jgi:hypothetical protein
MMSKQTHARFGLACVFGFPAAQQIHWSSAKATASTLVA